MLLVACNHPGDLKVLPGGELSGRLDLALTVPGDDSDGDILMRLDCTGTSQVYLFPMVAGHSEAAFGGLQPGDCSLEMDALTHEGTDCTGRANFTVFPDTIVDVAVPMICIGENTAASTRGGAVIRVHFSEHDCRDNRLRGIGVEDRPWRLGESLFITVETYDDNVVGDPQVGFSLFNDEFATAQAIFEYEDECPEGVAACGHLLCLDLGMNTQERSRASASVWVTANFLDDHCVDHEVRRLRCVSPPPPSQ